LPEEVLDSQAVNEVIASLNTKGERLAKLSKDFKFQEIPVPLS
jgi:hypothetical protein